MLLLPGRRYFLLSDAFSQLLFVVVPLPAARDCGRSGWLLWTRLDAAGRGPRALGRGPVARRGPPWPAVAMQEERIASPPSH